MSNDALDPQWHDPEGFNVVIEGEPPVDATIRFGRPGQDVMTLLMDSTAVAAVNAIPFVCAARPGSSPSRLTDRRVLRRRGALTALLRWQPTNERLGLSMTSSRHEGDTWDLASSVGVTATMVAAARAMATRAEHPLIDDPFAEPLVQAVGVDLLTRLATGETTPADLDDDPQRPFGAVADVADNMAVRTRFFDDFFSDATAAGIRQAVILASGLDARAYRLPWPDGTVVYEIDQPQVIEFKSRTLADLGAAPPRTAAWSPSTYGKTGRPPCAQRDSTRPNPPRGAPRVCWDTSAGRSGSLVGQHH